MCVCVRACACVRVCVCERECVCVVSAFIVGSELRRVRNERDVFVHRIQQCRTRHSLGVTNQDLIRSVGHYLPNIKYPR